MNAKDMDATNSSRRLRMAPPNPKRLAPSVDPAWIEEFIIERNLIGVQAARVGDDLVTIESHVRESGEGAAEIFGDPVAYARELPAGADQEVGLRRVDVVHITLGLAGILVASRGIEAWLAEEPVSLTGGDLAATGILALLVGAVLVAPAASLRLIVQRRLAIMIGIPVGLLLLLVAVRLVAREELLSLPMAPVTVVGVMALVLSSVVAHLTFRDGTITAPGEPTPTGVERRRWTTTLFFPVLLVFLVLIGWLPTLVS